MEAMGYVIGNLDCTIIAQKPKLSPHKVPHAGKPAASQGALGGFMACG